ncbi:unnamed protein product, partial [Prorocentrum cordatum]
MAAMVKPSFSFAKSVPAEAEYSTQCVEFPILALFPRPFLLEAVESLTIEDLRPALPLADARRRGLAQLEGESAAQSSIARGAMANATCAGVPTDDDTVALQLERATEGTPSEREDCMGRAADGMLDDWGDQSSDIYQLRKHADIDEVYEPAICREFWDQPDGAPTLQGAFEDIIHHFFDGWGKAQRDLLGVVHGGCDTLAGEAGVTAGTRRVMRKTPLVRSSVRLPGPLAGVLAPLPGSQRRSCGGTDLETGAESQGGAAAAGRAASSPILKVIELLRGMAARGQAAKLEEEAKYAAFGQWCKDETKRKLWEIQTSDDEISLLKATIAKAESRIQKLDARVKERDEDVARWQADERAATELRTKEADNYRATHEDYTEFLNAIDQAVLVLQRRAAPVEQAALLQTVAKAAAHMAAGAPAGSRADQAARGPGEGAEERGQLPGPGGAEGRTLRLERDVGWLASQLAGLRKELAAEAESLRRGLQRVGQAVHAVRDVIDAQAEAGLRAEDAAFPEWASSALQDLQAQVRELRAVAGRGGGVPAATGAASAGGLLEGAGQLLLANAREQLLGARLDSAVSGLEQRLRCQVRAAAASADAAAASRAAEAERRICADVARLERRLLAAEGARRGGAAGGPDGALPAEAPRSPRACAAQDAPDGSGRALGAPLAAREALQREVSSRCAELGEELCARAESAAAAAAAESTAELREAVSGTGRALAEVREELRAFVEEQRVFCGFLDEEHRSHQDLGRPGAAGPRGAGAPGGPGPAAPRSAGGVPTEARGRAAEPADAEHAFRVVVRELPLVPDSAKEVLAALLQQGQHRARQGQPDVYSPPEAAAYEFQSGGVVDMLKKLRDEFADKRSQLEVEELNNNHNYEQLMQVASAVDGHGGGSGVARGQHLQRAARVLEEARRRGRDGAAAGGVRGQPCPDHVRPHAGSGVPRWPQGALPRQGLRLRGAAEAAGRGARGDPQGGGRHLRRGGAGCRREALRCGLRRRAAADPARGSGAAAGRAARHAAAGQPRAVPGRPRPEHGQQAPLAGGRARRGRPLRE